MIKYIVSLLILFFSVNATAESSPESIRVGFTSVLTGPWAIWGTNGRDGVALAAQSTSNRFDIEFQDDRCDPKEALSNTRKFLSHNPPEILIVGCMENLEAIAPVARLHDLPVFALGNITDDILNRYDNVFALNAYADLDARFIAPYLEKLDSVHSIAIVHGTNNVGEKMGRTVEDEVVKRKLKVSIKIATPVETTDFRTVAARIVHSKPDVVWVHQSEATLLTFIRQLRESGYKGEIVTIFTLESDATKKAAPAFLEGVKYTFPTEGTDNSLKTQEFKINFKTKFGYEANANASIAFDALHVIDRAVTQCQRLGLECYRKFFGANRQFDGVAGRLTVTENRGALRPYGVKEFRGGNFIWVERNVGL